jgi:hypothetical protein
MKRIVIHETGSTGSEWFKYSPPTEPHPCDIGMDCEMSATEAARYIDRGAEEIHLLVDEMPLDAPKWKRAKISSGRTFDNDGWHDFKTRVVLELEDLGRCIIGKLVMNSELRSVLVLFPPDRKRVADETVMPRIAASVPSHVRDNFCAKIRAHGLDARGTVAFVVKMPHKATKNRPPRVRYYELLLARAGLRWAERRDSARKANHRQRNAA